MSKETNEMRVLRMTRIGIKSVLAENEWLANSCRIIIRDNWDKEEDKECRRKLYKAHTTLSKARSNIKICQTQLRDIKHGIRALNRQHDFRVNAVREHQKAMADAYPKTSLLG